MYTCRSDVSGSSDISTIVPQPRTWVDDISITSTTSRDTAKSQNQSETNRAAAQPDGDHPVLPEPPNKPPEAEEILEPIEDEPQFPEFICPSSEDKSREYAVRLWLANSDFSRAVKTVPLL